MGCLRAYDRVLERVNAAAEKAGHAVELMVVSKAASGDQIRALMGHGVTCFGENRWQAIEEKWIQGGLRDMDVAPHFIGPLQSNKLMDIAHTCAGILSLYKSQHLRLLASLDQRPQRLFCQVNIGREAQKSGVLPEELAGFLKDAESAEVFISGLMCIPPVGEDPAPYFVHMQELAALYGLAELSMGMSNDFETAIAHGATSVRIGREIFG